MIIYYWTRYKGISFFFFPSIIDPYEVTSTKFGADQQEIKIIVFLSQDFNAKLADFGLAKFGDGETHISTCVMGTWGYAAPEYIATGKISI